MQLHFWQPRVAQEQLLPLEAHKPKPKPKCQQRRRAYADAATAGLICAFGVFGVAAAQHVAISASLSTWSTAVLSQPRYSLAAASLPNLGVAIFAGGIDVTVTNVVDIFNATAGTWSTAVLSQARSGLAAASLPNHDIAIFAGGIGTCCDVYLSCFRVPLLSLCERGKCVGAVCFFVHVLISDALRRWWQQCIQCC